MNPAQLLAHFDRISDAPDAIPRLRRFILDLAVRGKLVEQSPKDKPPADFGVHEYVDGRDRLDVVLPAGWSWAHVADVADARLGKMLDKAKNSGKPYQYLRNTNVQWFRITTDDLKTMLIEDEEIDKFVLRTGDVLICEGGHPGRAAVWRSEVREIAFQKALHRVRPGGSLDADFLTFCLAVYFRVGVLENYYTGVGIPHFTGVALAKLVFPLPPLAEQQRIVLKVDELMALCDRLEAAQAEREQRRNRLASASLHRLNNGADGDAFREHVGFHLRHLSLLTIRPEQITALRQTILNLAVSGKLVAQDPKDEPASELLKRIRAEKTRLIKMGTIPRQKASTQGEPRHKQPVNWENVSFADISNQVTSGSRGWAEYYSDFGPKFIRAQNIRFGKLRLDDLACVNPPKKSEGSRTRVTKGDLLIVATGAGVTNPALLDHDIGEAYVSQHVALIKPTATCLSPWLLLCLMAPAAGRAALIERAYGAGKPGLNLDNIRSLQIPLPPLAEQYRIVAKVDELMALCDQLEAQLTIGRAESRRLLEAVLHEAIAPVA